MIMDDNPARTHYTRLRTSSLRHPQRTGYAWVIHSLQVAAARWIPGGHAPWVTRELPVSCRELIQRQQGVLGRWQASAAGLDPGVIDVQLRRGRWQPLYHGVYAAFTGLPAREAFLWAAVVRAGPDAVLSHQTAAELDKLSDTCDAVIHVTVDGRRQVRVSGRDRTGRAPALVVHRSARIGRARHPSRTPPRTRIEETTLDLTQLSDRVEQALSWLSRACGRRLTTADLLRVAMESRPRLRWRVELTQALADVGDGVHSALEYQYLRRVERPHGLPVATRQAKITLHGRNRYLDNLYQDCMVAVELDGQAAHPAEARWADIRRDNSGAGAGILTLRYSWADVTRHPCGVAAEVADVLSRRGWTGKLRPCTLCRP